MFTAHLWVRGPSDVNWRLNASFHREGWTQAYARAADEVHWYVKRCYRTYVGDEAPELDVPEET